jgi:hypothetical protein
MVMGHGAEAVGTPIETREMYEIPDGTYFNFEGTWQGVLTATISFTYNIRDALTYNITFTSWSSDGTFDSVGWVIVNRTDGFTLNVQQTGSFNAIANNSYFYGLAPMNLELNQTFSAYQFYGSINGTFFVFRENHYRLPLLNRYLRDTITAMNGTEYGNIMTIYHKPTGLMLYTINFEEGAILEVWLAETNFNFPLAVEPLALALLSAFILFGLIAIIFSLKTRRF